MRSLLVAIVTIATTMVIAACDYEVETMQNSALVKTQDKVANRFENVSHIQRHSVSDLGDNIVYFDVREIDEYNVSHIQNAIQIDPEMNTEEFLSRYENIISGKDVVFYCSVGMRSSAMAERIQSRVHKVDKTRIYNLEGGIFGWHNDQRPLVDHTGKTNFVHPYNAYWGRMINHSDLTRYD